MTALGIKNLPVGLQGPRAFGIPADIASGTWGENGVGALLAWNDRLYFLTYPAENYTPGDGGLGLYSIGKGEAGPRLERDTGATDVGRIALNVGRKAIMGRTIIDADGDLTPITGFAVGDRICGYAVHPLALTTKVIALTMSSSGAGIASRIYEVTVATATASLVADASTAPSKTADTMVSTSQGNGDQHFKSIWAAVAGTSGNSRLYVANNRHNPQTLSVVDPNDWTWTPLANPADGNGTSWINVGGCYMDDDGDTVFATGIDAWSGLLAAFDPDDPSRAPTVIRIPVPTMAQYHRFQQEWMRLRQVATERFILDLHGTWYDVSPYLGGGATVSAGGIPRMRALSRHYNTFPDFCAFDGHLAVALSSSSPHVAQFPDAGQPTSGISLRDIEDVARGPKPDGVGYWYRGSAATAVESKLMLVKGYAPGEAHFYNGGGGAISMTLNIRIAGSSGSIPYYTLSIPANSHAAIKLPQADYVSVTPGGSYGTVSAWVVMG